MAILFLEKAPGFILKRKKKLREWVKNTIELEGRKVGAITFVFEEDEEIYRVNVAYLRHDWYTDVISFDYNEGGCVNGDIMISVDRVKENAKKYGVKEEEEFHRVMIHGVLHLLGYEDDTEEKRKGMKEKEDHYLADWKNMS